MKSLPESARLAQLLSNEEKNLIGTLQIVHGTWATSTEETLSCLLEVQFYRCENTVRVFPSSDRVQIQQVTPLRFGEDCVRRVTGLSFASL